MDTFSPLTQKLIDALRWLPGIGPKSAQRMAFKMLSQQGHERASQLAEAISQATQLVKQCHSCRIFSEHEYCNLCQSTKRNRALLCIVETPADVLAFEQAAHYDGLYFVLHGHLSPLDGIGPEAIGLPQLFQQVSIQAITEVIIATNPTMEGEATAHYISQLLPRTITITRIAHGVPMGGEIEYLDGNTLSHALNSRQIIHRE